MSNSICVAQYLHKYIFQTVSCKDMFSCKLPNAWQVKWMRVDNKETHTHSYNIIYIYDVRVYMYNTG